MRLSLLVLPVLCCIVFGQRGGRKFGCYDGSCKRCSFRHSGGRRNDCGNADQIYRSSTECRKSCGYACFNSRCRNCRFTDCTKMDVSPTIGHCQEKCASYGCFDGEKCVSCDDSSCVDACHIFDSKNECQDSCLNIKYHCKGGNCQECLGAECDTTQFSTKLECAIDCGFYGCTKGGTCRDCLKRSCSGLSISDSKSTCQKSCEPEHRFHCEKGRCQKCEEGQCRDKNWKTLKQCRRAGECGFFGCTSQGKCRNCRRRSCDGLAISNTRSSCKDKCAVKRRYHCSGGTCQECLEQNCNDNNWSTKQECLRNRDCGFFACTSRGRCRNCQRQSCSGLNIVESKSQCEHQCIVKPRYHCSSGKCEECRDEHCNDKSWSTKQECIRNNDCGSFGCTSRGQCRNCDRQSCSGLTIVHSKSQCEHECIAKSRYHCSGGKCEECQEGQCNDKNWSKKHECILEQECGFFGCSKNGQCRNCQRRTCRGLTIMDSRSGCKRTCSSQVEARYHCIGDHCAACYGAECSRESFPSRFQCQSQCKSRTYHCKRGRCEECFANTHIPCDGRIYQDAASCSVHCQNDVNLFEKFHCVSHQCEKCVGLHCLDITWNSAFECNQECGIYGCTNRGCKNCFLPSNCHDVQQLFNTRKECSDGCGNNVRYHCTNKGCDECHGSHCSPDNFDNKFKCERSCGPTGYSCNGFPGVCEECKGTGCAFQNFRQCKRDCGRFG